MNYSSAIFKNYSEDLFQAQEQLETLEEAQQRKME
jgi:cyclopropane fatty-acyl-phospholipid synthase-like methyltransferase